MGNLTIRDAGVDVQITRETRLPTQHGFGALLFIAATSLPFPEGMKLYTSFEQVAADWPSGTSPYLAAIDWYSQEPMPKNFWVKAVAPDSSGNEAEGSFGYAAAAIAAGGYAGVKVTGLNYTETIYVTTQSGQSAEEVAAALNDEINNSSLLIKSQISGSDAANLEIRAIHTGTQGNTYRMEDHTSDTGLGQAVITQLQGGVDADMPPIQDTLDEARAFSGDWYALALDRMYRSDDNQMIDAAQWAEANKRLFFAQTNGIDVLDPTSTTDIASQFKALGLERTMLVWSGGLANYPEIGAFGTLATTSFRGKDTLKTLDKKNIRASRAEDISSDQLYTIKQKRANVIYLVGGLKIFDNGITPAGEWIDVIHGADALAEEIRVRVFGRLTSTTTKVPYTERGMSLLKGEVEGALIQYTTNGFLAGEVTEDGDAIPAYEIWSQPISQVSQIDKQARIAPDIQFRARLAGAIHAVTVNGALYL
jgi:hypothetical protein